MNQMASILSSNTFDPNTAIPDLGGKVPFLAPLNTSPY
jgi:hypothetical protein